MAERFIQSHIKRLVLFESLPDDQLELVAEAFQVLRFEPGALVFQQGQPAQGLFYFVSGRGLLTRVEVNPAGGKPTEVVVGEATEGQYVGETSLFTQTIENTSLRIVESAIVLFLSRQRLASLLMARPELRTNLGLQRGDAHTIVKPLFKGQRPDEVTLQVFRRHWWSYVRFIWIPLGLAAILIFGAFMFADSMLLALGLGGLALLLPAGVMGYLYTEWQDDAIIITDQRVVRVNNVWFGLQNSLSEIPLDHVHEVSVVDPPGDPMAHLFHYATVTARTASDVGTISMNFIPNAKQLRDMIFAHREQVRRSVMDQQRREIEAEVEKVLGLNTDSAPAGTPTPQASDSSPKAQSGFSFTPLRMRFIDEQGRTVFRRHWLIWLRHTIFPAVVFFMGVALAGISLFTTIPGIERLGFFLGLFLIGIGALWFYLGDWDWRNDQFILGDEVIIMIRRRPLFLQNEADQVRLDKIDSVVSSIEGVLNNLFNMGDVRISLIGSEEAKVLKDVYRPSMLQAEISERLARIRQQQQKTEAQRQREAISEYLTAYHEKVRAAENPAPAPRPANVTTGSVARDASPPPPAEPPPQPIHDAVRPPRVPRVRPDDLPP